MRHSGQSTELSIVLNRCAAGPPDRAVMHVGWDDSQGPGGVWILRESWGSFWGEGGYMRIAYGCSGVGYGAVALSYPGAHDLHVTPYNEIATDHA